MDEEEIKKFWEKKNIYQKAKQLRTKAKYFYFLDGPPYATGDIHIGTAWNKILKDCYIRFWRMYGFNVHDQPGYDTHGLPIENKVEKELQIRSKADIERLGVEKFILKCREFATRHIKTMNKAFANLGVWMNWDHPYLTLNNSYIEGAWFTFKRAFEKDLLYRGLYPVHVCPHCETAVAYNEIEYTKLSDPSIYVKFPVKNKPDTFLVIWTTTPWTLPANTGVMVHPSADYVKVQIDNQFLILAKDLLEVVMEKLGCKDYRIVETMKGRDLEGLEYEHPLKTIFTFQQEIKNAHRVVLSDQFVTMEDGTGLVHTAPGHGQEDYKVGLKNKLPVISPVNLNGTFNDKCDEYSGIFVKKADSKIINKLSELGLLLKEEKITHDYPTCWRCDSPLLQISVSQWFFRVTKIRDKLLKENKKVNWYPAWAKNRFNNWLENLGDWPISRQRYWGIPLPIWTCECGQIQVIGSANELPDLHRPYIDKIKLICKCGKTMNRVPDVLDVWFDSGLASWASLDYSKDSKLFKKIWPSDFQTEGPDQIRGWWNSQLITSIITFDKAPFKNILFHGFSLDSHGIKMSKSKGNIVTPEDAVKKYSRDALRFYLLSSAAWDDFYFNWTDLERIAKSFIIIENTFNFVKLYSGRGKKKNLKIEDKWILSRLNSLIENCTKYFSSYNAHKAALEIQDFIVNDFSRVYIKLVRDRTWPDYKGSDKESAFFVLNEVTKTVTKLLAPICPFLADKISTEILKQDSVHLQDWPKPEKKLINKKLEKDVEDAKKFIEAANNIRKENNIKLRWPLNLLVISKNIKSTKSMIQKLCNVKGVKFGKSQIKDYKEIDHEKVYLDIKITDKLKQEALLREVIRKIQSMRKNQDFVIKDKIEVTINKDLKKFSNQLKKEVGAKSIVFDKVSGKKDILVFQDMKIEISIRKTR